MSHRLAPALGGQDEGRPQRPQSDSARIPGGPADLLLRCLSARAEPALSVEVGGWSPSDWNGVADIAARHDLAPLLFMRLKQRHARACVPAGIWGRLRLAYFASAGRNTRLYRKLRPVLRGLRESGIKVIVLKGAFLAEAVYGDVALRPMYDVDIMVPRAELSRALAVLHDMGCIHGQLEDIESCCRTRQHLRPVIFRDLSIEIHWTIARPTGPFRIDTAGLWDRAQPATIAGVDVLALSPEDLLLHLCLHFGYQHRLTWLRSFSDIAETIHHYRGEVDWTRVVHTARDWGAARYVRLALHLVRTVLGAGVPDDVLERLAPKEPDQRELETATGFVLTQTDYRQWVPFFDVLGAKSLGDMAKRTWKRVSLSRNEMALKYPASRGSRHLYFYYALRFRDGIRAFGSYILRRGLSVIRSIGRGRKASLVNWLKSGKP